MSHTSRLLIHCYCEYQSNCRCFKNLDPIWFNCKIDGGSVCTSLTPTRNVWELNLFGSDKVLIGQKMIVFFSFYFVLTVVCRHHEGHSKSLEMTGNLLPGKLFTDMSGEREGRIGLIQSFIPLSSFSFLSIYKCDYFGCLGSVRRWNVLHGLCCEGVESLIRWIIFD